MTDSVSRAQAPSEADVPMPHPAFGAIFDEHFAYVCRSLQRLGVREADVEDVSQELFLAVQRGLPTCDLSRPIKPWLYGYVVRYASNYRRLSWNRARELEDAPMSPRIERNLEARRAVLRGLAALDDDKREALVLHDLEGFSAVEIAETLQIPLNTVYSRVRLAREAFRNFLRADGGGAHE